MIQPSRLDTVTLSVHVEMTWFSGRSAAYRICYPCMHACMHEQTRVAGSTETFEIMNEEDELNGLSSLYMRRDSVSP